MFLTLLAMFAVFAALDARLRGWLYAGLSAVYAVLLTLAFVAARWHQKRRTESRHGGGDVLGQRSGTGGQGLIPNVGGSFGMPGTTTRVPPRGPSAWRVFAIAALLFVLIGVPLFWSGSLTKDATPAEKKRWDAGFIALGTGVTLACISGACLLITKAAEARSRAEQWRQIRLGRNASNAGPR